MTRIIAIVVLIGSLFPSGSVAVAQEFSQTVCVHVYENPPAPLDPFMTLHLVAQSYPLSDRAGVIATYALIGTAVTFPGEFRPVYGSAYDNGSPHFAVTVGPESTTPGAMPAMLLRGVVDTTDRPLLTPGVCQQRVGDSPCGVEKSVRLRTFMNDQCAGLGIPE